MTKLESAKSAYCYTCAAYTWIKDSEHIIIRDPETGHLADCIKCIRCNTPIRLNKRDPDTHCQTCGIRLPPSRYKYCSDKCYNLARSKPLEIECENCKQTFRYNHTFGMPRRWCSKRCYQEYNAKKELEKRYAKKGLSPPNLDDLVKRTPRPCQNCGKQFIPRLQSALSTRKFCSRECYKRSYAKQKREEYWAEKRQATQKNNDGLSRPDGPIQP